MPEKWELWRGGTHLRGANLWQKRNLCDDGTWDGTIAPAYGPADLPRVAAWGANYLNISHPGTWSERPPYRLEEAVFRNLEDLIRRGEEAGCFVVISYRTGPGRNEFVFEPNEGTPLTEVWDSPAAQDGWVRMWGQTAARLKGRKSVVGYDLMVEPESKDYGLWNALAVRMTDAIRAEDGDTPILVGAADWSSVDGLAHLTPTGDPKTVYAVHQYEPFAYTHQEPKPFVPYPGGLEELYERIRSFRSAHGGVPVAVNEFGAMRFAPGVNSFVARQLELIETVAQANHALWLWETSTPLDYDEFNFRHGPDLHQHTDVESSALITVIKDNWKRNLFRPGRSG